MWLDLCLASNEFALSPAALYWACIYMHILHRGISQTIHSHEVLAIAMCSCIHSYPTSICMHIYIYIWLCGYKVVKYLHVTCTFLYVHGKRPVEFRGSHPTVTLCSNIYKWFGYC